MQTVHEPENAKLLAHFELQHIRFITHELVDHTRSIGRHAEQCTVACTRVSNCQRWVNRSTTDTNDHGMR